ncbi:MAG: hypothetical protein M1823_006102 [Watsoniomyces obsoletus]|nr:MAG: hypothetical protein M1823_006102 [Watsoniomyces obsoletus]
MLEGMDNRPDRPPKHTKILPKDITSFSWFEEAIVGKANSVFAQKLFETLEEEGKSPARWSTFKDRLNFMRDQRVKNGNQRNANARAKNQAKQKEVGEKKKKEKEKDNQAQKDMDDAGEDNDKDDDGDEDKDKNDGSEEDKDKGDPGDDDEDKDDEEEKDVPANPITERRS